MIEYIIRGLLRQVCKRQKLWNLTLEFLLQKVTSKNPSSMMEYIIRGVLLQVCTRQKLWNLIFHFHYSALMAANIVSSTQLNFCLFIHPIPKIGLQRFAELEILSNEFFFHTPLEIFILKKLATLDISYFKVAEAIDSEPKRMEYFIVCAPWYLSLLY